MKTIHQDNRLLRSRGACAVFVISGLFSVSAANAALIDRGNGLIYDTVLQVTWLQDPQTSIGAGVSQGMWDWANGAVEALSFGSGQDWHLPNELQFRSIFSTLNLTGRVFASDPLPNNLNNGAVGPFVGLNAKMWSNEYSSDIANVMNLDGTDAGYYGPQHFKYSNYGGVWAVHAGDLGATVAAVPEPQTYALLALGLSIVGWSSRKRLSTSVVV